MQGSSISMQQELFSLTAIILGICVVIYLIISEDVITLDLHLVGAGNGAGLGTATLAEACTCSLLLPL